MAVTGAPRNLAPPPSFIPRDFGLLSVVEARYDEPDGHWQNGVTWQDLCGLGNTTLNAACWSGDPVAVTGAPAKADNIDLSTFGATPFTVYAEVDCPPVGFSVEEALARGRDALNRTEAYQVENAFWTGTAAGTANVVYPHLAANSAVLDSTMWPIASLQCAATPVTGSTILDLGEGIGRLEAAFAACYQGRGVIHIPTVLGESLFTQLIAKPSGTQLKTNLGNLIALGGGYPGTGPDGTRLANAAWVYMTGPVFAYKSGQITWRYSEQFNKATNTGKIIVEQTWLLGYSCCCLPAVPISVGGDVTGQPLSAF